MLPRRPIIGLIGGLCAALVAYAATAGSIESAPPADAVIQGVVFSGSRIVDDVPLDLHAVGLLRRLFFNGYAAALYLGDDAAPAEVLSDVPKRLELHDFRSIPASLFGEAAQDILERNVAASALAELQERVDRLASWYVDIEAGDRYALSYLPGSGTRLEHNGNRLGAIPGAEFAAAYFAIWLGAAPLDAPLRDQLLRSR